MWVPPFDMDARSSCPFGLSLNLAQGMKEESKWLTALAYDEGLYERDRMPFGLIEDLRKLFLSLNKIIIQKYEPIRDFCFLFVDDGAMSVCSETWTQHV
jgi:hypothetical protein